MRGFEKPVFTTAVATTANFTILLGLLTTHWLQWQHARWKRRTSLPVHSPRSEADGMLPIAVRTIYSTLCLF